MGEPGRQHSGGPDEKAARRRCARTRFAPKPSAPRLVRALLRNILQDWNASDLADRAELPVTELVTNAVLHARTEVEVVVKLDPYALRIEVHDHSTSPPLRQPHDLDAGTGHGLKLVAACANRWGVAPTTTGKAVWFELDRP
jgi:anti-sigma regulatory factor (Ser/Thr protein kinase)